MPQNSGDNNGRYVRYIEPDVGQERYGFLSELISEKECEECANFDKDLAADYPCGLCYESTDKPEWRHKDANIRSGEMELPHSRVCEASA